MWSEFGPCSVTCENGTQTRNRTCMDSDCPDGTVCPGDDIEEQICVEECCPGTVYNKYIFQKISQARSFCTFIK